MKDRKIICLAFPDIVILYFFFKMDNNISLSNLTKKIFQFKPNASNSLKFQYQFSSVSFTVMSLNVGMHHLYLFIYCDMNTSSSFSQESYPSPSGRYLILTGKSCSHMRQTAILPTSPQFFYE